MQRDLMKYIADYEKRFLNHNTRNTPKGAFYMSDIKQLYEVYLADDTECAIYHLIDNCLISGFMVGYKCRQNEERKK